MSLTLYTARFDSVPVIGCSPPSWAVWLACLEKGIEFEHHQLDFAAQEHKSPVFLAVNPKGTLPALFDNERLVSETRPMLECIERQSGPRLLGESRELRARGLARLNLAGNLKEAGMAWLSARVKQKNTAEQRAAYSSQLERFADEFGGGLYFAAPDEEDTRPGLADFLAYAYLATTARLGFEMELPHLVRWMRAMAARDSVHRTAPLLGNH
jgi:glutathione S-transferase